jgi:hypothetical protein
MNANDERPLSMKDWERMGNKRYGRTRDSRKIDHNKDA